jgi:hypothetical protein
LCFVVMCFAVAFAVAVAVVVDVDDDVMSMCVSQMEVLCDARRLEERQGCRSHSC